MAAWLDEVLINMTRVISRQPRPAPKTAILGGADVFGVGRNDEEEEEGEECINGFKRQESESAPETPDKPIRGDRSDDPDSPD